MYSVSFRLRFGALWAACSSWSLNTTMKGTRGSVVVAQAAAAGRRIESHEVQGLLRSKFKVEALNQYGARFDGLSTL